MQEDDIRISDWRDKSIMASMFLISEKGIKKLLPTNKKLNRNGIDLIDANAADTTLDSSVESFARNQQQAVDEFIIRAKSLTTIKTA